MTGCNTIGDITPTDASANDVTKADAAIPACGTEPAPVMQVLDQLGNEMNADWSCYTTDAGFFSPFADADPDAMDADLDANDASTDSGTDAAPDAGADAGPAACRFRMNDFVNLTPVPTASVDLFFHNTVGTPDFSAVTGDLSAGDGGPGVPGAGEFLFACPGTPVMGYRVNAGANSKALIWLDILSPRPGKDTLVGASITPASFDLLGGGIAGTMTGIDPMKMNVVIGVRDCKYRDVLGGVVELVDDSTGIPLTPGQDDFRAQYFGPNGFPDPACKHTVAQQSLYAAINVPTDRPFSARAKGRMSASDPSPVILGSRKMPSVPGMIVIVRPYRITTM